MPRNATRRWYAPMAPCRWTDRLDQSTALAHSRKASKPVTAGPFGTSRRRKASSRSTNCVRNSVPRWRKRPNSPRLTASAFGGYCLDKKRERTLGKHVHIRQTISAAGLERDRALDRPGNGHARVAGRIAIAITARPSCSCFAKSPHRAVPFAYAAGDQQRILFGRRPHSLHLCIANAEQRGARSLRIDHRATDEVRRGAGHCEQRRSDETSGRRLRNGDRLLACDQALGNFLRERQQGFHRSPRPI